MVADTSGKCVSSAHPKCYYHGLLRASKKSTGGERAFLLPEVNSTGWNNPGRWRSHHGHSTQSCRKRRASVSHCIVVVQHGDAQTGNLRGSLERILNGKKEEDSQGRCRKPKGRGEWRNGFAIGRRNGSPRGQEIQPQHTTLMVADRANGSSLSKAVHLLRHTLRQPQNDTRQPQQERRLP